jgi:succinate dehydrogenase flavin-adding protein (antitoxin of CptAB toxin-antitoxin module)
MKTITIEIVAVDEYEAEGINDALGSILEREDWQIFIWETAKSTPEQEEWYEQERTARET